MIQSVLIFNNDGLPRLVKFYTPIEVDHQMALLKQVHSLVIDRTESQCSFLTIPPLLQQLYDTNKGDIKVIYRHYATLYFVFIVDGGESELGILDLIQVFVQVLNRCFRDVCELDLVFHWQVLQIALEEMIQGGMVIETSILKIFKAIDDMNDDNNSYNSGLNNNNGLNIQRDSPRRGLFTHWPLTR